uniref:Uncharacterized protein n=1 Tax=Anguilla anguilla TaxID=7936 RepID=A0A0E9VLD2_ANGAN
MSVISKQLNKNDTNVFFLKSIRTEMLLVEFRHSIALTENMLNINKF